MQNLALIDKVQHERVVMCPYYDQDGITIYNANCLEAIPALRLEVDCTITSPPYNVGKNNMTPGKYETKKKDSMSDDEYFALLDEALGLMIRHTKYYVFFNIQMLSANRVITLDLLHKYKYQYKDRIMWNKDSVAPQIEPGVMNNKFEDVHIFARLGAHKRKFDRCNFKQGTYNNVITGSNASGNEWAKLHKATYPDYLPGDIINNFTLEGDTILDPFMGTGTTLYVAKRLKRKAIGIEISQKYCDIAIKRLAQDDLFS